VIAVVTVLAAFPLGYLLRNRLSAVVAYAILYLWAFVFQGIYLMLATLDHQKNPAFEVGSFPWSYGVVAGSIFAVGFGLVFLGHRVGAGRRAGRGAPSTGSAAQVFAA
jgi:hypothetical protein